MNNPQQPETDTQQSEEAEAGRRKPFEDTREPLYSSGEALTLRALHEGLVQGGTDISYKTLSDLCGTDDVAMILGARGGRNKMAYPIEALEVIQGFLAFYRKRKATRPQAARLLRQFLENGAADDAVEDVKPLDIQVFNQHKTELASVMEEFIATVKNITPIREDSALTRSQAALLLACPESSVCRFVRPLRRGIYRKSDVMRYLASGIRTGGASGVPETNTETGNRAKGT